MGEHEASTAPVGNGNTEVSQSTVAHAEDLAEPSWVSPHDTHVYWPKGYTNDQKVEWLLKEFHLFRPTTRQPAASWCGPVPMIEGFDWNNYDPKDHVLVHRQTFLEFISWGEEATALRKGMKTINRKRRKANAVQRRTERRLAQARAAREHFRRSLDTNQAAWHAETEKAVEEALADHRQAYHDLYWGDQRVIDELRSQIRALAEELSEARDKIEYYSTPANGVNVDSFAAAGYTDVNNAIDALADGDGR